MPLVIEKRTFNVSEICGQSKNSHLEIRKDGPSDGSFEYFTGIYECQYMDEKFNNDSPLVKIYHPDVQGTNNEKVNNSLFSVYTVSPTDPVAFYKNGFKIHDVISTDEKIREESEDYKLSEVFNNLVSKYKPKLAALKMGESLNIRPGNSKVLGSLFREVIKKSKIVDTKNDTAILNIYVTRPKRLSK